MRRRGRAVRARRRSLPGCRCLREARPEDTQSARARRNRQGPARPVLLRSGPATRPLRPPRGYRRHPQEPLGHRATPSGAAWLPLRPLHGHCMPQPGTPRTANKPARSQSVGPELLHRERSGAEHVPFGTADDGALHRVLSPSPRAVLAGDRTATLRDERAPPEGGTPPAHRTPQLPHPTALSHPRPHPQHHPENPHSAQKPHGSTPGASHGIQMGYSTERSTTSWRLTRV